MVINSIRMVLDQNNLLHNINYLEKAKNKKVLPVVKANAYGHGVNVIVPVLYKSWRGFDR
jgi:alanine racemase